MAVLRGLGELACVHLWEMRLDSGMIGYHVFCCGAGGVPAGGVIIP